MQKLSAISFGLATGLTACMAYIGCILLMLFGGKDITVSLSNVLFHGVDFSNIMRMDVSITEEILGVVISFLFWGILGYITALIYNKLGVVE